MASVEIKWCGFDVEDASRWQPPDPLDVAATVVVEIGEPRREGTDRFTVCVGTPEGIVNRQREYGAWLVHGTTMVDRWSWPDIETAIHRRVTACDLGEWRMSSNQLARYYQWEFQDYNEVPDRLPAVPTVLSARCTDAHLPTWEPTVPDLVHIDIELDIGLPERRTAERFAVTVSTPAGLRANADDFVLSEGATLLVDTYRWPDVEAALESIAASCRGRDWAHSAEKLARTFARA